MPNTIYLVGIVNGYAEECYPVSDIVEMFMISELFAERHPFVIGGRAAIPYARRYDVYVYAEDAETAKTLAILAVREEEANGCELKA